MLGWLGHQGGFVTDELKDLMVDERFTRQLEGWDKTGVRNDTYFEAAAAADVSLRINGKKGNLKTFGSLTLA